MTKLAFLSLWLFTFVMPWENYIVLPGFGAVSRAIGVVAFGIGLLALMDCGQVRKLAAVHWLMALFVAWCGLTYFWSPAPEQTLEGVLTNLQLFAMVWLYWQYARGVNEQLSLLQGFVLGSGCAALGTITTYLSGELLDPHYLRYALTGFNPGEHALILALSLPMALYLATIEKRRSLAWLYRLQMVCCGIAILLTASRAPLLAALATVLLLPAAVRRWTLQQKLAGVLIAALGAVAALSLVPAFSWQRLASTERELTEGTLNDRTLIWALGLEVLRDRPVLGVGLGAYAKSVERISSQQTIGELVAHNTFLSVLVETGMIGFGIFLAILLALLVPALRLPLLERRYWQIQFLTWAIGVSALTWENRKPTWFLMALLSTQVARIVLIRKRFTVAVTSPGANAYSPPRAAQSQLHG